MNILLTNDDGIQADGLRALHDGLRNAGHEVHVVAPVTEQSAVGHMITFSSPLRVKEIRDGGFFGLAVSGSPADCVKLGVSTLLARRPDLVISGINAGANVGVDILYSGTVSAATEGALMGLPSLAVSYDSFLPTDLAPQGRWVGEFVDRVVWGSLPAGRVLNLNFPAVPMEKSRGLRLCPQTKAVYRDWYVEREDPRGKPYYWLEGEIPPGDVMAGSDRALLNEGYITLTPLKFDFTDLEVLEALGKALQGRD